jgi:hypothetical protein
MINSYGNKVGPIRIESRSPRNSVYLTLSWGKLIKKKKKKELKLESKRKNLKEEQPANSSRVD